MKNKGFTLIEVLITITFFAVMGMMLTMSLTTILKTTKKSENIGELRKEMSDIVSIIERHLRNAKSVSSTSTPARLIYTDPYNNETFFLCDTANNKTIASGSATLNSAGIKITGCNFTLVPSSDENINDSVEITLTGESNGTYTITTKVYLRNKE